jgi:hypothetical protein
MVGSTEAKAYRNEYRTGRMKTAEGMVLFSAPQVRDTTEPFASAIRENLGIGRLGVAENAHKQKLKTRSNQVLFEKLSRAFKVVGSI